MDYGTSNKHFGEEKLRINCIGVFYLVWDCAILKAISSAHRAQQGTLYAIAMPIDNETNSAVLVPRPFLESKHHLVCQIPYQL